MLRYFYILICIQLCFCMEYIENNEKENEPSQRWARSKPSKLHKKHTRSTKKSQLVEFDVQNFISSKEDAVDYDPYMNRKSENKQVSDDYGDYAAFMESHRKNRERKKTAEYSNVDPVPGSNTRSSLNKVNPRHFNFHPISFDDGTKSNVKSNQDTKVTSILQGKLTQLTQDKDFLTDPDKKCSYKNMKVPFFSYNKSITKARQKKRKLFCFSNCHKTTSTTMNIRHLEDNTYKLEDFSKEHHHNDRIDFGNKVSKRAYEQLCPKCIRELLHCLKRKTSKKGKVSATTKSIRDMTKATKEKTEKTTVLVKGENLDDNLEDGYYNLGKLRKKRFDEEIERERRIKELEEVEKKIENVHVTAPTFARVSLLVRN